VAEFLTRTPRPEDLRGRTRLLVLQGTPFCNIACRYCYLPDRSNRARMAPETVRAALRWLGENGLAAPELAVVWHAGEPLALPVDWYRDAFAAAAEARPHGTVLRHCIQTNGTLIDDRWCALFREHGVQIGLSLDGPARLHDAQRRTRSGRGTHDAVMRGVAALQRHRIPFHAICVVGDATLDAPEELVEFFAAHRILDIGFNVEEVEGIHTRSSLSRDRAGRFRGFFERAWRRAEALGVEIREVRTVLAGLQEPPAGAGPGNDQNTPFDIVTVTHDGSLHTFSPELAGLQHPRIGALALGNVRTTTLRQVLDGPMFRQAWAEIAAGIAACARDCAYFPLCRGGAPSNKLGELGTFAGTETMACRLGHQEIAEAVLHRILQGLDQDPIVATAPMTHQRETGLNTSPP